MSGPAPEDGALHAAARWCAGLTEALAEIGRRVGALSDGIARDWPDDRGREWADRTAQLHRRIGREADAAVELGDEYARQATDPALPSTLPAPSGTGGRGSGMRLGGTDASRAEEERGIRIAELPADQT